MKPYGLPLSVLLLAVATLRAGTLTTVDGEAFSGTIKKTDDGWQVTQDDGRVRVVPAGKVKSLELGGDDPSGAGREVAGLKSLRRSVEFSDDLAKIIDRYRTFISQTKDANVLQQAKEDLTLWQTRREQGLVRVGKTWGTAADRDARLRNLRQQAEQVRLMIKAQQFKDAERGVAELLADDPQNVSGLYLAGVLAQKRRDVGDAKKQFTAVQQGLPQHPPTLLNLAILHARQKQWAASFSVMDQALAAAPGVQVLLDNAAEIMAGAPPEQRKTQAAQRLIKTFFAQDAELQQRQAARHLHRWGSQWIDDTAFDKIRQQQETVKKQQADLQNNFNATQQQITAIDDKVRTNEQAINDLEASTITRLPDGTRVRLALPKLYYDLQAENGALKAQRDQLVGKLDVFREEAKKIAAAMPQPTYTGVLTPIDEDGVPLSVLPGDTPTTAPAEPQTPPPATQPETIIRIGPP